MTREEAWSNAYCAVAGTFNAKEPDCVRYADACLKAFDERFPPMRHEPQWLGTPLSQLSANQREEMDRHFDRMVTGVSA